MAVWTKKLTTSWKVNSGSAFSSRLWSAKITVCLRGLQTFLGEHTCWQNHISFASWVSCSDVIIHICYCSGFLAERTNLRYFLTLGMITSGIFTYLFGIAKSYGIHYMWYFTLIQVRESFLWLLVKEWTRGSGQNS